MNSVSAVALGWKFPSWTRTTKKPPDKKSRDEFLMIGMRRSGHHAVRDWIAAHYDGEVMNHGLGLEREWFSNGVSQKDIRDCYIFSVENVDPLKIEKSIRMNLWESRSGTSERHVKTIILRDPYNLAASVMRRSQEWGWPGKIQDDISLWARYAAEFLGETKCLPAGFVWILYNKWFSNKDYRKDLEGRLGVRRLQVPLPKKHSHIGSSFDTAVTAPLNMKVEERWKHFGNNSEFRSLFADRRINQMAKRIFGEVAVSVCSSLNFPL